MKKNVLLILILVYSAKSFAQTSDELFSLQNWITNNGKSKQWFLKDTRQFLGPDTCSHGVTAITFINKSKILFREKCVSGQWKKEIFNWDLTQTKVDIFPKLIIKNKSGVIIETYQIEKITDAGNVYLRLRNFDPVKDAIIVDLLFQ